MRITDYQNVHGVKDVNHGAAKTSRVNKTHEDEFEQELADCINKRKSKKQMQRKKDTQQEHQALVDESQELEEEMPNHSDHISSWA